MTFLPIVARELRVAARQRGTYWTRLSVALVALLIGGWIMLIPGLNSPRTLGIALFVALSVVTYIYCLLIGLRTTADCLSEEKRDGTLGLLFLTDLKGYDIVFGKLVATSLNAFYGMLALFPVLAISLLVGGVTGGEFWRVVLASMNNLFFSLAVGMLCSALSRDGRKAMSLAFAVIVLFTIILPVTGIIIAESKRLPLPYPIFFYPSPGYSSFMAFDETSRAFRQFDFFYGSVLCVHLMSWAFLILACFIVPRTWQDKAQSLDKSPWRRFWHQLGYGSPAGRKTVRRRLLEINPFYWLTARDRMKTASVWAFLGAGGLLWLWGLWKYPNDWKDASVYVWTGLIAHTVLKMWLATEACRRLAEDRKSGALELILSTPLAVTEILRGQRLALWRQFAGPAAVVLVADFIFLMTDRRESEWVLFWAALMIVFLADLITLSWVSMWMGLASRHANRASAGAMVRIMILPWLAFGLILTFFAVSTVFARGGGASWMTFEFFVCLALGLALANNVLFGSWAWRKLHYSFRFVATQRFDSRATAASKPSLPLKAPPVIAQPLPR